MIAFTVPGKPHSWQRTQGSGRRRYESKEQGERKRLIRQCALSAAEYGVSLLWTGPLGLHVVAVWARPQSRPHCVPVETWAAGGECWRPVCNDCDNVAKSVMDALEGLCYGNDSQISELHVATCYAGKGAEARTEIVLERLDWTQQRREP